jgi:hypothetical protein
MKSEMSVNGQETLRLTVLFLLLACTAAAGFLWGQRTYSKDILAAIMTTLALWFGLVSESTVARSLARLHAVEALLLKAAADGATNLETADRLELIVAILDRRNQSMRSNMLADRVHAEDAQRRRTLEREQRPKIDSVS